MAPLLLMGRTAMRRRNEGAPLARVMTVLTNLETLDGWNTYLRGAGGDMWECAQRAPAGTRALFLLQLARRRRDLDHRSFANRADARPSRRAVDEERTR